MKKSILVLIILLSTFLNAQNETNHWLFGNNAYLEFGNSGPINSTGSSLTAGNGTAAISDFNGNLLFYTNGVAVWSRDHGRMRTPGSGPGVLPSLDADLNATQNCLIVPMPGEPEKYYIFTINSNEQLLYSIVDMTLNGGFGLITQRNVFVKDNVSGRMTAVHHENGEDFWLTVNAREDSSARSYDFFYTFLISASGITQNDIKEDDTFTILETQGQMKFSPDGTRLAFASSTGALVFEFDSSTGKIGNYKRVSLSHPDDGPGAVTRPYGVAFTNDSRFIYFDSESPTGGSRLAQWDVLKDRNAQVFFIPRSTIPAALQLGKDGKIYNTIVGSNSLSVINNPIGIDETEIDFVENNLNISPNSLTRGLPSFVQSFFRTRIATNFGCVGEPTDMYVDSYSNNITSVIWDFGDGNSSSEIRPAHVFNTAGTYTVKATATINGNLVNLTKKLNVYQSPILNSGQKIVECDNNNDGKAVFNLTNIIEKIITPTGDELFSFFESRGEAELAQNEIRLNTTYRNKINYQQELFLRVNSKKGCYSIVSFTIETSFIELNGIIDEVVCENSDNIVGNSEGSLRVSDKISEIKTQFGFGSDITLEFYPNLTSLENEENAFTNEIVAPSGEIWVRAQQAGSCSGLGKFNLTVNSTPPINLKDLYTICFDPSIKPPVVIYADNSNEKYEWRNSNNEIISTSQELNLNQIGNYSLTVYKTENGIECTNSKNFTVVNPEKPNFLTIEANTEDQTNNIVSIEIEGNSNYEFSLDNINFFGNSTTYTFTNVQAGLQTIYVRDINNCEQPIETKVAVIGFRKYFTPNGDGDNDFWNIKGLDATKFKSINVSIFNRFGNIIFAINDFNSIGWDGNYNGKPMQSNNYWFKAEIVDNDDNVIKESGNFSLIRN